MFTSPALAHRIDLAEARLVAAIVARVQARHPHVRAFAEPVAGGFALFAGAGNPVNKVIGIGFDAPPAAADLERIERRFSERGAETRAEVSTLARAETHEALARRGYVLTGFENVLGRPLAPGGNASAPSPGDASLATARVDPSPAGIDVRLVQASDLDASDLDAWVAAVTAGFSAPDDSGAGGDQPLPPSEELAAVFDDIYRAEGFTRYLALVDGEIAGGASMRLDEGIAFLAGATTLPRFRRRGVQRALLARRLHDAAHAGATLAVVSTQPGTTSQANVQRHGFALLYSRAVVVRPA
jgi:GNAT superfamily N-acetyltransferase